MAFRVANEVSNGLVDAAHRRYSQPQFIPLSNTLPAYTKSQLSLRNGQDKPEIWIAYKGVVYDVTESRLWRNGKHYEHWAGQDLTDELKFAPHTVKVFERFKAVGKLEG